MSAPNTSGPAEFSLSEFLKIFEELPSGEPPDLSTVLGSMAEALEGAQDFSCPSAQKARRGRPLGQTARNIRAAVDDLTDRYERMTVRQVFYALEVAGVVAKTEGGYRQVQQQLVVMRREGLLDWAFITDGTRWRRKPDSWDELADYIEAVARSYRRDLWRAQGHRIEVWLEKDALADVIVDVTTRWDVSLMVSRGQSSATFLHAAAKTAERAYEETGAETYVYTLYDYDAGGDRASSTIARELPAYAPRTPIWIERLAVTPAQIAEWDLPTRPPKKKDPQAKAWGDKPCVELDAIDPARLTSLVEGAILRHVDQRAWAIEQQVEQQEREGLLSLRDAFRIGAIDPQPEGDA